MVHDIEACCPNEDTAAMYRATKTSANLYRREAQRDELVTGWAMGPRELELAACGTFYLRQARGENELVLPMLPSFSGPDDFGEQLRWWIGHDDERERVAKLACEAVADRTFDVNALRLLHLIYG
jgi:spore maturation protein CgeB